MFAGQQDGDERLEILVGQRHMGCAEGRDDLESREFEVGAAIDDHERESLQARFAKCQDLGLVACHECRDTEPIPGVESATEAPGIRAQDLRVEFVAAHDQERIIRNRPRTDPTERM